MLLTLVIFAPNADWVVAAPTFSLLAGGVFVNVNKLLLGDTTDVGFVVDPVGPNRLKTDPFCVSFDPWLPPLNENPPVLA